MKQHKAEQLAKYIAEKAAELGLVFVDGPNITPSSAPRPDYNTTNGQERAGFDFSVAKK
jgi:hypothetical protein